MRSEWSDDVEVISEWSDDITMMSEQCEDGGKRVKLNITMIKL